MKLVVFCVETDKKAQIDNKYIDKAVHEFYVIDNNVKIGYAYMNGKGNFDSASVESQIKRFLSGDYEEYHIIYCVDTDNQADSDTVELNKRIKDYCLKSNYDLVWFCKDIEEVFLHKRINKSEKVEESNKFRLTKGLCKANLKTLSSNSSTPKHSNLLIVLNNIMTRK